MIDRLDLDRLAREVWPDGHINAMARWAKVSRKSVTRWLDGTYAVPEAIGEDLHELASVARRTRERLSILDSDVYECGVEEVWCDGYRIAMRVPGGSWELQIGE